LALEDCIEVIVDDISDLLSDGRLNDIVDFARIHDNILPLSLERVGSRQRPQNISLIRGYCITLKRQCCKYGHYKDMNISHHIIILRYPYVFSLYHSIGDASTFVLWLSANLSI